jgi:hypothetical protein
MTTTSRSLRARSWATAAVVAALLLAAPAGGALAAPVLFSQASVSAFDADDQPLGPFICFSATDCQGTHAFAGSTLNYHATATAGYGVLKVSGASSIDRAGPPSGTDGPSYTSTQGVASFRDQWTITGAPAGTTGTLLLSFDVTGSYDFSQVNTGVSFGLGLQNIGASLFSSDNELPPYTGQVSTTFTFGQALDFRVSLVGGSQLRSLEGGGYDGQSSFMDMSNTAVLDAIVVKDAAGNVIPFGLTTASGASLFADLVPSTSVPEPATLVLALLGGGLLGAGRALVRRRERARRSA